jgi:hypothetical protein
VGFRQAGTTPRLVGVVAWVVVSGVMEQGLKADSSTVLRFKNKNVK